MTFTELFPILIGICSIGIVALSVVWCLELGLFRGATAGVLRIVWLLPLVAAFYPRQQSEELPRSLQVKPVNVLIDDSQSMAQSPRVEALKADIQEACGRYGCVPKFTYLSEEDSLVASGYTPLSRMLEPWIYKVGTEPWVLISDGGDFKPALNWDSALSRVAVTGKEPNGFIAGVASTEENNIFIEAYNVPPFSFESKPIFIDVTLRRSPVRVQRTERIQVQVLAMENALATVNATFEAGDEAVTIQVSVPALPRGQHLLTLRALPTPDETALWDNTVHGQIEVLPNTVGVLHLLGSPSWDGRFLRRYLKSEPKYDLISFFILRDPWDSQQVSERELSLIPFPVERLFTEELPNFRVIVIQNFTLFQFLQRRFQYSLVEFVKNGGGLLFIGGPRALQKSDLSSSPLGAILPFETDYDEAANLSRFPLGMNLGGRENEIDKDGPYYDGDLNYKISLAQPGTVERALANVFDDWEALSSDLTNLEGLKGLHRMDQVEFKKDKFTPLLNATTEQGETVPLAVASYPEKGRALWLFSDSIWRMAMNPSTETPRKVYSKFLQAAMTWLMRQDLRKPLTAKNFQLVETVSGGKFWRVNLIGPAARYFKPDESWQLVVCGTGIPGDKLQLEKKAADEWEISGPLLTSLAGGQRCQLQVSGEHPAFGSVKASITAVFPETFKDEDIGAAAQKLEKLAQLTGAQLATEKDEATDQSDALLTWIEKKTGQYGVALPSRFKTIRNFYWILDQPWFFLLLIALPLEVIVRRWHHLMGSGSQKRPLAKPKPSPT